VLQAIRPGLAWEKHCPHQGEERWKDRVCGTCVGTRPVEALVGFQTCPALFTCMLPRRRSVSNLSWAASAPVWLKNLVSLPAPQRLPPQRGSRVGIVAGHSAPFIAKRPVFLFSCLVAHAPGPPVSHARLGFLPQLAPAEMRPKHFTQVGVVLKPMQSM